MEIIRKLASKILPLFIKNHIHLLQARKASLKYENPSQHLKVIGVTGTDGKTSTATMLYEILQADGRKVGLVSTISARVGDREYPTGFHVTTPDPESLQKFLREMVDVGLEYVVLETTSHGLDQNRVAGITYSGCIYTNITREHLDYHKTFSRYLMAKAKLMKMTRKDTGFAVINKDDGSYEQLEKAAQMLDLKTYSYGLTPESDIFATEIHEEVEKTEFTINFRGEEIQMEIFLPGQYNVYNALAATMTALNLGVKPEAVIQGLSKVKGITGRWEVIQDKPFKVVVDFAHTPNALYNVLQFAQEDNEKGRVIVVFGSAGKRDQGKRPLMGESAGHFADITVLTAEDPRGENIEEINTQIAQGLEKLNKIKGKDYFSIPDRSEAIKFALSIAKEGDTVIATGKGHERSMNLDGEQELPWSDQEVIVNALAEMKKGY